jgi:hypothetical protein
VTLLSWAEVGDSLKAGLTAAFGRSVTKQDERMFAQIVAGLTRIRLAHWAAVMPRQAPST